MKQTLRHCAFINQCTQQIKKTVKSTVELMKSRNSLDYMKQNKITK